MSDDGPADDPIDGQEEQQLDADPVDDVDPKDPDDKDPDNPDANPDDKDPDNPDANPDDKDPDDEPPQADDAEPPVPIDEAAESQRLRDIFKEGLTQLSRTLDNSSFAFAHLNASAKEIERVFGVLKDYPHVRYLLLSENKLKDIESVAGMHSLLLLDASQNDLRTAKFLGLRNALTYLQSANLSQNKLRALDPLALPRLKKLSLDENLLRDCESFAQHRSLESLSLKKNKIRSLKGLEGLSKLRELFVDENALRSLEGLQALPSLEVLSLQTNQIKELPAEIPVLPRLKRLNLVDNKLAKFKDLKRLLSLGSLVDLALNTNPFEEELQGEARKQLIIMLCVELEPEIQQVRELSKVNEEDLTEEEMGLLLEDLREEKRKRLDAEEEERQRLADEAEAERIKRQAEEEEERQRKLEELEALKKNNPQADDAGPPADPTGDPAADPLADPPADPPADGDDDDDGAAD